MEQILTDGVPPKTAAVIMVLYKNAKVKVCSSDGDTYIFDIVTCVLEGDALTQNLFIICVDHVLQTSINVIKEIVFTRSRRYPARTVTDADYPDDIVILANTPAQADSLLLSQEKAAGGVGLHVNAYKTEYMLFNQNIS